MSTMLNEVNIVVTNIETSEKYLAKSYPDADFNNNGKIELYQVPIYYVTISGKNESGKPEVVKWRALRFMPYWNDPKFPDKRYKTLGWVNSGKHKVPRKKVTYYNPNYKVHNTWSPYDGAIQIEDSFLIHAGPDSIAESGWGAAGCVEVIGGFDKFKSDIWRLSGKEGVKSSDEAILKLVKVGKLFVQVDYAFPPDLKSKLYGEFNR